MKPYAFLILLPLALAACGNDPSGTKAESETTESAAADYERGPHNGRLLRDGDFSLEVTVFEDNAPPVFRLYAFRNDKPIAPTDVTAAVALKRLDGEVNDFTFKAEKDYLVSNGVVTEPHSFDVEVKARAANQNFQWSYASYEGRTTIERAAGDAAGILTEAAGPATLHQSVALMGNIGVDTGRSASVRGRFSGVVRSVTVEMGQQVSAGQTLATVEGNDSMRTYAVVSPLNGVVLSRATSVGDMAGDAPLFEVADLSKVWVDLRAIGTDAESLAPGQAVQIRSATGALQTEGSVQSLLPVASVGQSVVARVSIPNPDGKWRPGMAVAAKVIIGEAQVPLAVKESGLQRFRDFTVVFAQVGDTYEVRMLKLGRRDGEFAEVLGGLKPDTRYVSEQSYLIRADIEKSGASHDH